MIELNHIRALNWQLKLNAPAEIVADVADIAQCIDVILRTPKGSDPHRPEFGSDVWRYLDYPLTEATPRIIRAVNESVSMWETRAVLDSVKVIATDSASDGHMTLRIKWHPTNDVIQSMQTMEILL